MSSRNATAIALRTRAFPTGAVLRVGDFLLASLVLVLVLVLITSGGAG